MEKPEGMGLESNDAANEYVKEIIGGSYINQIQIDGIGMNKTQMYEKKKLNTPDQYMDLKSGKDENTRNIFSKKILEDAYSTQSPEKNKVSEDTKKNNEEYDQFYQDENRSREPYGRYDLKYDIEYGEKVPYKDCFENIEKNTDTRSQYDDRYEKYFSSDNYNNDNKYNNESYSKDNCIGKNYANKKYSYNNGYPENNKAYENAYVYSDFEEIGSKILGNNKGIYSRFQDEYEFNLGKNNREDGGDYHKEKFENSKNPFQINEFSNGKRVIDDLIDDIEPLESENREYTSEKDDIIQKSYRERRNPGSEYSIDIGFKQNPIGNEIKSRNRTSPAQLSVLEKVTETVIRPNRKLRQRLAMQLNMTQRQVQIWFQNYRAKLKKRAIAQGKRMGGGMGIGYGPYNRNFSTLQFINMNENEMNARNESNSYFSSLFQPENTYDYIDRFDTHGMSRGYRHISQRRPSHYENKEYIDFKYSPDSGQHQQNLNNRTMDPNFYSQK